MLFRRNLDCAIEEYIEQAVGLLDPCLSQSDRAQLIGYASGHCAPLLLNQTMPDHTHTHPAHSHNHPAHTDSHPDHAHKRQSRNHADHNAHHGRRSTHYDGHLTYEQEEELKEKRSRARKQRKESEGSQDLQDSQSPSGLRAAKRAIRHVVEGHTFEVFFCVLIFANTVYFGIEAEYMAATRAEQTPLSFHIVSIIFSFAFAIELALRLIAYDVRFCKGKGKYWNFFETAIVIASFFEAAVIFVMPQVSDDVEGAENLFYMRMLRIARTARTLRAVRIVKFLRSLRVLLLSMMSTIRSLAWVILLILMIMYLFAVLFTQAAQQVLAQTFYPSDLDNFWGSIGKSIYTLFMAVNGGVSWREAVQPLSEISWLWVGLFVGYVAFINLAVLNVVTGVFCQTAIESAMKDQHELRMSQNADKDKFIKQLTDLFVNVDDDGSGELTIDEFEELLQDERLQLYCASLDITIDDAWALFKLLDNDGSGAIGIDEFVSGCLRLRGAARAVDLALTGYQLRWIIKRFENFMRHTDKQLSHIRESVIGQAPLMPQSKVALMYKANVNGSPCWNPANWS